MIVIADTGPVSYLIRIGEIDVLPQLGQVVIPETVCNELKSQRAPEAVRHWIASPPAWLEDSGARAGAGCRVGKGRPRCRRTR